MRDIQQKWKYSPLNTQCKQQRNVKAMKVSRHPPENHFRLLSLTTNYLIGLLCAV